VKNPLTAAQIHEPLDKLKTTKPALINVHAKLKFFDAKKFILFFLYIVKWWRRRELNPRPQ